MKKAQQILKAYTDELSATRKKLSELEKRAARVNSQQQDYKAAQSEIRALKTKVQSLREEHQRLQTEWTEADFNDDLTAQREIKKRREQIDKQIADSEKDIRSRVQSLDKPNPIEVGRLAAERDSLLNLPSYTEMLSNLEGLLEAEKADIRSGIAGVKLPSGMDQDSYKEKRESLDPIYAAQQRSERYYAKQDAERKSSQAHLPRADNTDEYHRQLGNPRTLSGGNMTVLESGREVRPYSLDRDD